MAFSMAAMMAASAVPFFLAYGRDSRRPVATSAVVLIYVAVWALIGFGFDYVMGTVMMPSSLLIAAAAVAVAVAYALTPWGRWARDQCREMAQREPRGPRFRGVGRRRKLHRVLHRLQRGHHAGPRRGRHAEPSCDRGRGSRDAALQDHALARAGRATYKRGH
jgi:hypothetical protein